MLISLIIFTSCRPPMKGSSSRASQNCLDISQFILKEHSPCFRPAVPERPKTFEDANLTPELSPKIDGVFAFAMTPVMKTGTEIGGSVFAASDMEDLESFCLEEPAEEKPHFRNNKMKKDRLPFKSRFDSLWHFVDDELDRIVEENLKNQDSQASSEMECSSQAFGIAQEISEGQEEYQKFQQEEKQSTEHFELPQETVSLEWMVPNPKKELLTKLKKVVSSAELTNDQEKMGQLKATIEGYIFQHQKFYFEQTMNNLKGSLAMVMETLNTGIEQTFKRNIGGLSFEKRRVKLLKYMDKKKKRVWKKKVNYDCRKKVADGRLRIKGKFVTYEQACEQLNVVSLEGYTADEVRSLLQNRC